ncbi:MAG: glycoside hydrolase family 31 protein [Bacteroidales bacterium]|nr:glycoside hydrolase family 31 protein [Bacteroidales bacterium]
MNRLFICFLSLVFALPLQSQYYQEQTDGITINATENNMGIKTIKLKVFTENIIQVVISPVETFSKSESLVVTEKMQVTPQWNINENEKTITLSTQNITVIYNKQTNNIRFLQNNGKLLLADDLKEIIPANVMGEKCFHIKQSFNYSHGESLYGLGSYMDGEVRLNAKKVEMLQRNREDVVPVIISTNGYGLLWDNYSLSEFNDTKDAFYLWSEVADEINYYFIYGENTDQIVNSYRLLTGKAPMYPKWVFGYMQSKQKYDTQEEIVSVVKKFRELKFPLDLIIQDWQYWPQGQWGQKSFNRQNYPDPQRMTDDIHAMNAKIIISIWPDMATGCPNNFEMKKINGLMKNDRHLNVMMPEARKLYWKQTNDSLFHYGIDGWWADCSEGYDSDWTSPFFKNPKVKLLTLNADDLKKMYGQAKYINSYALMHTKGLYEGQRETTSDKRVYILTRSAFAGLQKYGASYWTGDVSANWEEFREQIPAGINFCMTGIPYWTTDIAGYFIKREPGWWFSNGVFESGQKDTGFLELYTRWFQFAAFSPLFRAHGWHFPREPWAFGDTGSQTYETLLKFTNLRYRLLPYIYSQAWKVTNENYTIMRGLTFDFMHDSATHNINDQYMFGPSFLVCPVTKPLYYLPDNHKMNTKEFTKSIYLPEGTKWIDFWTGKSYDGGRSMKADASFETMPIFVKAGSIIPMGPFIQYSTEMTDPVELRIYPGADGKFTLYEDENDNYNYEKGMYSIISFEWKDAEKILTIDDRKGEFPGMKAERTFNIHIVNETLGHGVDVISGPQKTLKYSGKKVMVKL